MNVIAVDLDGTLISTFEENDNKSNVTVITMNDKSIYVMKRWWADTFLGMLHDAGFKVGIWTAGTRDYAHHVLMKVFPNFPFYFALSRQQCTDSFEKNLELFIFPVILIDNDPSHVFYNIKNRNRGCIVICTDFKTDEYDQTLLYIADYIKKNIKVMNENMRKKLVVIYEHMYTRRSM